MTWNQGFYIAKNTATPVKEQEKGEGEGERCIAQQ